MQPGVLGNCNHRLHGSLIDVLSTYHWGLIVIGGLHVNIGFPSIGSRYVPSENTWDFMCSCSLSYRLI